MTEKQYSLVYYADKGGAFIRDNKNSIEWYHDSRASLLEIVDKLNELAEENKKLKQEIKGFEGCSHNFGLLYDEAKNKVEELSKENKELKQEIESLKMEIVELRESENDNYNISDGLW